MGRNHDSGICIVLILLFLYRIDQTISWSKPTTSFQSSNYTWEYEWDNDGTWNSNWQTGTNPATWSDNAGSNVSGGDAVLSVRTKHYGTGNDSYSGEFLVTLKKVFPNFLKCAYCIS